MRNKRLKGAARFIVMPKVFVFFIVSLIAVCGIPKTVRALSFDIGENTKLDVDTTLTYGAAWRVDEKDDKLLANINGDDGDRSFDKGSMVNNKFSASMDMDLQWYDFGLFMRGRAFYDFAYMGSNDNDSPDTHNSYISNGGSLSDHQEFSSEVKDRHGRDAELLDAFIYGSAMVGENPFAFKAGRHVVSWGESLFIANGISGAQSPLDTTAANAPGSELKDIFLPLAQVSASFSLPSVTFAAYYQFEWEPTRFDESGSYFSTMDPIDDAGHTALVNVAPGMNATVDRTEDEDPSDSGSYGVAMRFIADWLNATEFGFYFLNYSEFVPTLVSDFGVGGSVSPAQESLGGDWGNLPVGPGVTLGDVDPGTAAVLNAVDASSYHLKYQENVKLYGASFSSVISDVNVSGEISYRPDLEVPVKAPPPASALGYGWRKANALQAQVSAIAALGDIWIANNSTLMAEWGFSKINGLSNDELYFDKFATGGAFKLTLDYYNVIPSLDIQIPISYKWNPQGISSVMLGTLFHEGANSFSTGMDFTYLTQYKFGFGYTQFNGSPAANSKTDRDYVSFNAKYTF